MRVLLIAACLLLAAPVWPVPVDPDNEDEVAGMITRANGSLWVLRTNGEAYTFDMESWEWVQDEIFNPPVPVTEILNWEAQFLVTQSGEWWMKNQAQDWVVVPGLPWYPASAELDEPPPASFATKQYPNPFNPRTTIAFTLVVSQHVRLAVYDVNGNLVAILADVILHPGNHEMTWDGRDNEGREMASGVYFYQLEADSQVRSGKMALVR